MESHEPGRARVPDPASDRSPTSKLCDLILAEGVLKGGGKIRLHSVEPDNGLVDFSPDGSWRTVMKIPLQGFNVVVARLKLIARLGTDLNEPQQGETQVQVNGQTYDLRMQTDVVNGSECATLTLSVASAT